MRRGARAARLLAAVGALAAVLPLGGCRAVTSRMPRIGSNLMPPVVPYAADTVTLSGRRFYRLAGERFDVYAEAPTVIPPVEARLRAASHEFARHFGAAPPVAVLVFDGPADPYREFDFDPWVQRGTQVLAFVRDRRPAKRGELGVDEALLDTRLAELLLAAYADSVVGARTGRRDAGGTRRAVERLPHWFAEAVVTRVARPDAVDKGLSYVKANRVRLMPLRRLFGMSRLGVPTWGEFAGRARLAPVVVTAKGATPPALVAAHSTAFGQFLVDRYGPTFLQAVADELLAGHPTEQALVSLPGVPADARALEREWATWLGGQP